MWRFSIQRILCLETWRKQSARNNPFLLMNLTLSDKNTKMKWKLNLVKMGHKVCRELHDLNAVVISSFIDDFLRYENQCLNSPLHEGRLWFAKSNNSLVYFDSFKFKQVYKKLRWTSRNYSRKKDLDIVFNVSLIKPIWSALNIQTFLFLFYFSWFIT